MEGYKQQKMDMKSGKLNVRRPSMARLVQTVATELAKYKFDVAVLEELRLETVGTFFF
jgi:hypothetical protein